MAKIDAVQAEYSAFETLHERDGLVDTARELDVAYVAYGPLGHGWLVDNFPYESPEDFNENDYRRHGTYMTRTTPLPPLRPTAPRRPFLFFAVCVPTFRPKSGGGC